MRRLLACWIVALAPAPAWASFLSGEMLDAAADVLAIVVLFLVPAVAIVVFWIVHVLPEKIAHKRHHPQTEAITTLCLLSLVFGGLLWPLAWIWAYTKPVAYRMAYGTDRHPAYYDEMADKHREGKLATDEAVHLREELEAMESRGALPPRLRTLKENLAEAEARVPARREEAA
jgi:CBS domain containing-hemolysin-like protein